MALAAGTRLGPYEIVGLLGAGGMGEVYSARDTRLGRKVALKVLRSEVASDPDRLRRFEREARTVAALNHPHILTVHDVGTQDSIPYVVTELLEGETLRELLKSRSPTQKQVLTFAVQIARGLAAAHDKDIVHRDLKPENLFLTTDGRIKILDFGLAKLTTREADIRSADTLGKEQFTSPGVILGTVAYMSPEQARALPLDPRTDIFSFGVVLYEMLAHKHPFLRDTAPATLVAILNETPPDLASLGRGIPPALGSLVQRCLEKEKQDRFRGTHDLALALETMLQAPSGVAALEEVEERSPYPGLSSFTEKDAPVFFGREGEVTTLWEKLRSRNLLAVIGPSGAGKTSFVRAGVLPARPPGWAALVCAPGRAPMRALARALAPELAGDTEALTRLPDFEELDVAVSLLGQWRRAHDEALVVVDQFEELFTLGSPEAQERFAELIGRLTREADVHVLLSLRDDFLMRCHQHEPLARVFSELTPLDTLTREGLRRAVTEPARTRDCAFGDESLIDEMVGSVEGTRAALPLLAFAVSRLWEKRDRERKLLTRTAYEEIGGVAGALAQHAEQTLERVGAGRQGMVREIFRNLVTSQGTRASSDREELLSIFPEREAAEEVLDELIDARLLTSYEVSETREPDKSGEATLQSRHWIEIVHESLLKAWPRLVMWQAQEEEGAVLRDQLKQAAHLWEEKDRSPDLLWSGTAFREFELWRDRYPGKLTALEEDFSTSMIRRARRQRRARRGAVVAAFLVLVGVAGTIAVSRQQAVDSARRAEASQLLALAQARFTEDPTEALAFTVASLEVADGEEARLFAMRVLEVAPPALEVEPGGYRHVAVAFSPSGGRLAVGGGEKVRVLSAEPEDRPIGVSALEGEGEDLPHGGFRGDWASNELLVTSQLKSSSGVSIWSLTGGGERVRAIDFGEPSSWQVGPNLLLAETPEDVPDRVVSRLRSWPLPDGDPVDLGRVDRSALGVSTSAFLPNGTGWLYAKGDGVYLRPLPSGRGQDRLLGRHPAEVRGVWPLQGEPLRMCSLDVTGEVRVWALSQQEPALVRVISPQEDSSQPASAWRAPDPTLRWAAGFDEKGQQIRVWNLEARPEARPLRLRRSGSWFISSFEFHPRGTWLAATTRGAQHVTFWPLPRARPRVMDGYTLPVRPLAF
ncbi:MAG: protein kinase, partial [Acidobacteriota bacterium]